jgi:ribose-phosphate pyrophosphokinase
VGDFRERPCHIVVDIITTGGPGAVCSEALLPSGARPEIFVAATHGLFVAGATERLRHAAVHKSWVTDTLPQPASGTGRVVVSVAPMIAAAIEQLRPSDGPEGH